MELTKEQIAEINKKPLWNGKKMSKKSL